MSSGSSRWTGPGPLLLRDAERVAHQRRNHRRRDDLARQLGQRPHRRHDVDDLEPRLPRRQDALLAGDHDHRHRAEQRVGRAGREIQRARPERGDADARLAGKPAVGRRHEGRGLLMAGDDQLDRRFADGFDDVEVFLAGNSEDPINTLVLEGGDEKIRALDHARSPGMIGKLSTRNQLSATAMLHENSRVAGTGSRCRYT